MTDRPRREKLPVPQPLDPHEEGRESKIAADANRAFDLERHTVPVYREPDRPLPGVPLDEILDPARIEEYCAREPWILNSLERATAAKFGFIPERFKYLARAHEKEGRYAEAAACRDAHKQGLAIYYEQLKRDFRSLASGMDRREIGAYAQRLWLNVTTQVDQKGANAMRFIGSEKYRRMDPELRELARFAVYKNTKWLALAINDIPMRGAMPAPKPVMH